MNKLTNPILIASFILISTMAHHGYAKNLGAMGETYPIAETDFLEFIQSKALAYQKSGQWQQTLNSTRDQAEKYRDRPTMVDGLSKTLVSKVWDFDPSIILGHNISTSEGKLIALAGTRINPLVYVPLSKTLIFINADDKEQVTWAVKLDEKLAGKDKVILVGGSVLAQEDAFKKAVYFDQGGRLVKRFSIEHIPATVAQNGLKLRIHEVKL